MPGAQERLDLGHEPRLEEGGRPRIDAPVELGSRSADADQGQPARVGRDARLLRSPADLDTLERSQYAARIVQVGAFRDARIQADKALAAEKGTEEADAEALLVIVRAAIERALVQLRSTPREQLLDERKVGRAGLPSTVLGLLCHGGEHTLRHAGQAITTAKIVRGA